MPLLAVIGRKSFKGRIFLTCVYTILVLMGITMIVPFMISISSSTTNEYDYNRFRPLPRYFYSQNDRYIKGLVRYFNRYRGFMGQLRAYAPHLPTHWQTWSAIGEDYQNIDTIASEQINFAQNNPEISRRMATDYFDFSSQYPVADSVVAAINAQAIWFVRDYYVNELARLQPDTINWSISKRRDSALELISERWELPYENFYALNFTSETSSAMHFQGFFFNESNAKVQDFIRLKEAYRSHAYTPGVKRKWLNYVKENNYQPPAGREFESIFPVLSESPVELQELYKKFAAEYAPATPCIPYALRAAWVNYLQSDKAARLLNMSESDTFTIDSYNSLAQTNYVNLETTPFPLPREFPAAIQVLWHDFVANSWPLRLTKITVNPTTKKQFAAFLEKEIKYINVANNLLGTNHTSWDQFELTAEPTVAHTQIDRNRLSVWKNFVAQTALDIREVRSSETEFQVFLQKKYGSLDAVNQAYNWNINYWEEAFPPFLTAYTQTFLENETAFIFTPIYENYAIIIDYLLLNSSAVFVTIMLVGLVLCFTLTINPIAAYSLSRFRLRGKPLLILFMLSTMAFPAMVSAIPAYLLMRDLGLFNTFWALVLPGAANGMAIFILKGFFDSLPPELFEAATIDGASEFQVFRIVAMPMVKPILAINCLNAFIHAYNGWEWALIICQKKEMWTIAVWMYQATTWWNSTPWIIMAGFVVTSIPTFLVFVFCQKMILRGIVLPSMK